MRELQKINRRRFIRKASYSALGATYSLTGIPSIFETYTCKKFMNSDVRRSLSEIFTSEATAQVSSLIESPYLLVIHCDGGWDPTLVFDNKIGEANVDTQSGCAPATGANKIPYIDHLSRPAVRTFFNTYGDQTAIVNGIHVGSMSHDHALRQTSGIKPTGSDRFVDWLGFYGFQQGSGRAIPHVVIDAPQMTGIYGEYAAKISSASISELRTDILQPADSLSVVSETALKNYLNSKFGKLLEGRLNKKIDSEKLQSIQGSYIHEATLLKAVNEVSPDANKSDFANNMDLAIHLMEEDYSKCVTIQAGSAKLWDTHIDNEINQSANFEMLFDAINNALSSIQANSSSNLTDNLTIIIKSEMGRSPKINSTLQNGKGHWPFTSALLWGQGINGGKVFGRTDSHLRGVPMNPIFGTDVGVGAIPLEMKHIFAGLFELFGIPSSLLEADIVPASALLSLGT